jgi:hypothetical protein
MPMATPRFEETTFPLAYCPACEAETLTHVTLADNDEELRSCIHCDTVVTTGLVEVPSEELEDRGYSVIEARTCGNGGGCGSGGCGTRARS